MGYRIFTEASSGAPVVTLEDGERLVFVDVVPDGTNDVSLAIVLGNLESPSGSIKVHRSKVWQRDFEQGVRASLHGPGTLTFSNLGSGGYVVMTVR